jgi:chromosome segregation ATPase
MSTTRIAVLAWAATLFVAAEAAAQRSNAQTLQAIKTEVGAAEVEMPKLAQRNGVLVRDSETAKKEWDVYSGQIPRYNAEVKSFNARAVAHDRDARAQNAQAAAYRARCLGRQLPPGEYQSCTAWQSRVNAWGQQVNLRKAGFDRERTRLNAQKRGYDGRMAALKVRMERNMRESEQIQARLRTLRARVAELRELFGSICATLQKDDADVGEAEAHCNSVDFDGTKPNLPPLGKPKPPFSATPN